MLAENHAGAAPWYQLAYKRLTEETPFTFPRGIAADGQGRLPASCKPNRGPEGAPLFLINHWVSTDPIPRPSDATRSTPTGRCWPAPASASASAITCPTCWRSTSTSAGDVFRVADTLNGV